MAPSRRATSRTNAEVGDTSRATQPPPEGTLLQEGPTNGDAPIIENESDESTRPTQHNITITQADFQLLYVNQKVLLERIETLEKEKAQVAKEAVAANNPVSYLGGTANNGAGRPRKIPPFHL